MLKNVDVVKKSSKLSKDVKTQLQDFQAQSMFYTGMCGPKGCDFLAILVRNRVFSLF